MIALHKSPTLPFWSLFLLQFVHRAQPSVESFDAALVRGHEACCYYSICSVVSVISTLSGVYLYKHWPGRSTYSLVILR